MFELFGFIIYVLGILMLCVLHLLKAFRNLVWHIDVLSWSDAAKLLAKMLVGCVAVWGMLVLFTVWSDYAGSFMSGVLETVSKFASVEFWSWVARSALMVAAGYVVLRFVCNRVLPVAIVLLERGYECIKAYRQYDCQRRALIS